MKLVRQLLQTKRHNIWSIAPDASVFEAIKLMAEQNIGVLLVLQHGQMIGVLSERDYARKVILEGKSSSETRVDEIMTRKVLSVHPDESLVTCMSLMTEHHIRHLPVLAENQVIGVISIGDVIKAIISEQEFMIEQLAHYIIDPPALAMPLTEYPLKSAAVTMFATNYQQFSTWQWSVADADHHPYSFSEHDLE